MKSFIRVTGENTICILGLFYLIEEGVIHHDWAYAVTYVVVFVGVWGILAAYKNTFYRK